MAYPAKAEISFSYVAHEQSQGDGSFPGQEVDVDLFELRDKLNRLNDFVRGVTRSDGRLANQSVNIDTLAAEVLLLGLLPLQSWVSGTAYGVAAVVFVDDALYVARVAHTAGASFAADLAAGRWIALVDIFTPPEPAPEIALSEAASSVDHLLEILEDGRMAKLVKSVDYDFAIPIAIPENAQVVGTSKLRYTGALGVAPMTFESGITWEDLDLEIPGEPGATMIIPDNYKGERIRAFNTGALSAGPGLFRIDNTGLRLDEFYTEDFARPLQFGNAAVNGPTSGGVIGHMRVRNYIRAFNPIYASDWRIDSLDFEETHPNADGSAGQNGCLINSCARWRIGEARIRRAPEHSIRLSGDGVHAQNLDWEIGSLFSYHPGLPVGANGGCHIKINADHRTKRGKIGHLTGVGGWAATMSDNSSLLRISHADDISVGYAEALTDQLYSCHVAVQQSDSHLTIDHLHVQAVQNNLVDISDTVDVGEGLGAGPVSLRISSLTGSMAGMLATSAILFSKADAALGDVLIDGIAVEHVATNFVNYSNVAGGLTGRRFFCGALWGATAPVFLSPPDTDAELCELRWNARRCAGRVSRYKSTTIGAFLGTREAFTARATSAGNSVVPDCTQRVRVTDRATDANDWIVLPPAIMGREISGYSVVGHKMRCPASSGSTINNVVADGAAQAAIPAATLWRLECPEDGKWILTALNNLGAVVTPIVPA